MRAPSRLALLLLGAAVTSSCGGPSRPPETDAGPEADAEPDGALDVALEAPGEPAPPASPEMTPCPPGWREVPPSDEGDVTTCDPWPSGGSERCDSGEAHFPGEPGCSVLGPPCGDSSWAVDLPDDRPVLRVLASAPSGGDGTVDAPFRTIGEALAAANPGDVVAVGRGIYEEAVTIPAEVTLWGACTAETVVAAPEASSEAGTVTVRSEGTQLRSIRIGGEGYGLWVEGIGASLHAQDVAVEESTQTAIVVTVGATLSAESLVVRDTRPRDDDVFGRGLLAERGARVFFERAVFERNREVALSMYDAGTEVSLADVAVVDTLRHEVDWGAGTGVQAVEGAHLRMERAVIERSRRLGMLVADGAAVELEDVVIRDNLGRQSDGKYGRGMHVQSLGTRVEATRLVVDRALDAGLSVTNDALLVLTDVVVRDTACSPTCARDGATEEERYGRGLQVNSGGILGAERVLLLRNTDVGIGVIGAGSTATLESLSVRDMRSHEVDVAGGHGLEAIDGASVALVRALFERCLTVSVAAADPGTTLHLVDVAALSNLPEESTGFGGRGLEVFGGAAATLERVLVDGATDVGIVTGVGGTSVTGTDLVVRGTSGDGEGLWGRGLAVQQGGLFEVSRVVIEGNRDAAIMSSGRGTEVRLAEARISGTLARGCAESTCGSAPAGSGVVTADGGYVELTRFLVAGNALAGVMLAHGLDESGILHTEGGTVDLHEGEVSGNPIGVSLQTDGFDIQRLMDRVVYRDNGRDLDSEALPAPAASVPY